MAGFRTATASRLDRLGVAVALLAAGSLLCLVACSSPGSSASVNGPVTVGTPSGMVPAGSIKSSQPVPKTGTVVDLSLPASIRSIPLRDQDGRVVTLASLAGKTIVVSPNLTLCQEFCPLISANLGEVNRAANSSGLAADVVVLEVTVDPGRDDYRHLKAYQALYGAEPNWEFLRGTAAQIAAFWNAFHLGYDETPNDPKAPLPHDWLTGAPMTYDVDHQNIVYVIAPNGHIEWLVDAAPYINGEPIPATLLKFLDKDGITDKDTLANPDWTAQDVEQAVAYVSGHPIKSGSG